MKFFRRKKTKTNSKPKEKVFSCSSCGLYENCISPRMKPYGNFKKEILNIAESPGELEDSRGLPFQGRAGKLLQRTYKKLGIDLFEDCLNINSVSCRPMNSNGENREPTNNEINNCRRRVLKVIEEYKPKMIILLGNAALITVIGHRWKKDLGKITKWRGFTIPDQDFKAWICPAFHPSYVLRNEGGIEELVWEKDLKGAFDRIDAPLPQHREPKIEIIDDLSLLNYTTIGNIKARTVPSEIAFDIETTGLKPHAKGHEIVCAAIADSPEHAYVFMLPKTRKELKPLLDLLSNENINKVIANSKFELTWCKVILRTDIKGHIDDTMIAAHIFDNRQGITGLKFQVYVCFGIIDYASEISPYLEGDKTNANSFNKIKELIALPDGKEKLLKYNGYDAIYEFRLKLLQQTIMNLI